MKRPAVVLAVVLMLLSVTLIGYRILWLGYPRFPTVSSEVWQLSIQARAKAGRDGLQVEMGLPYGHPPQTILSEQITSGTLDFTLSRDRANRIGVWSGSMADGEEFIRYRATILMQSGGARRQEPPETEDYPPKVQADERALAERLAERWRKLPLPHKIRAIVSTLDNNWGDTRPDERDLQAWYKLYEKHGAVTGLLVLLRAADIPARPVEGLLLIESVRTRPLIWLEVWTGTKWDNLRLSTGEMYRDPNSLLPLRRGQPAIYLSSGKLSELQWTISREIVSQRILHFEQIMKSDRWLDRLSLFHLPGEFQETFRVLLLVPMSALVIGVLRNVIGFPMFGIFMPVLMALAFRNTGLLFGLGIFSFVIAVGYLFRRALNSLRLLLVPRLSVLLTLVIACLTGFALAGKALGLREFMAVGLLPIVILTMTIERFFVITEEAGAREGLHTALGSAAVAAIIYEIIRWEALQLTFFVYPELLFAVAALQVLLGRYTGYRLSEFARFRAFGRK
jgi:hypothetical protein